MVLRRVPFELAGDAAPRRLDAPEGVTFEAVDDEERLSDVLARALEASIDPRDIAAVRSVGAGALAAGMIEDARAGQLYRSEREWWSIVAFEGEPAGVVLPVVFRGCARGALDEGTIYHLAVLAGQRSRGLGRLLLGRATDTLLSHGVWRIFCDTAAENAPMIRLFEQQGWKRLQPVEVAGPQ